jgi:glycosyltransferase involved in cell wall biosynthesis
MRFVHVNHRYAPFVGGSERFIQEVSESAAADGHDVTVVTSDAQDLEYFWDRSRQSIDAPTSEVINGVRIRRVPVRHVPGSSILFRGGRRLMGELSRLPLPAYPFRLLASNQPWMPDLANVLHDSGPVDLVHATNLGLEGLAIRARELSIRRDVPFVLTPFIHLGVPGDTTSRRYVSMPHQVDLLRSSHMVLVMTEMEREFVTSVGVAPQRIVVTGAGVDIADVTGGDAPRFRERYGIRGFLVASLGPPSQEKGTKDLIQSVSMLRKQGMDVEAVLAGPPMSEFNHWFSRLDPADRDGIHVLGFVDPSDKRDLLAAMDALAVPSRSESCGIVYLEAWANGKPVIAANAGAVPELVRHGENGLLVPFGNPAALRDAIAELMRDAGLAVTLGDVGRELVKRRYTWDVVVDRVFSGYEVALGMPLRRGDA